MLSTTFPALVAVVIVRHAVLAWRQRAPVRTCVLIPEDNQRTRVLILDDPPDPAVVARIKAYTGLTMVERYGSHGPP